MEELNLMLNAVIYMETETGDGPVSTAYEELMTEVRVLFALLAAGGAAVLGFWLRKFTWLLGWVFICMIIGVFVYSPDFVGEAGSTAAKTLFSGWLDE